ncbi:MAG: ATP-binding protein [Synergistaceae bacterium]|nr:ATP-binding protein [Synergistaceae bacterium]MBR0253554.1 ATP-binding protein [Synergistaceae bacterium]
MFRKAEKKKAKLRLAITGVAGSGKTYGALKIAQGLGGRIAMIDTENGSGDLYSDKFDYDICSITAPYTVQKYLRAIQEAEEAGYNVLIIDSLSHAWAGEGGLLDLQGKITDSSRSGNSWAAWRQITPQQKRLIEMILSSKCHVIATMRSKTEYIQVENDQGKKEVRKIGLAPIQREGVDYEFTTVFDLAINHFASVSKDRTGIFDGQIFQLSEETGEKLKEWLDNGVEVFDVQNQLSEIWNRYLKICNNDKKLATILVKKVTGNKSSSELSQADIQALNDDLAGRENLTASA